MNAICEDDIKIKSSYKTIPHTYTLLSIENDLIKRTSPKKWKSWSKATFKPTDNLTDKRKNNIEINDLMPFVKSIAQRIHRNQPSSVMLNDLVQDGMIGLIKAFKEYNADLGVPLIAFAKSKISWAIMDGLRAGDWADNHVRGRANKVSKTADQLQASLLRKPTHREIAEALGVRVDDVTSILRDAYGFSFVRVDDIEGQTQDIPDSRLEPSVIVEKRQAYARAVASLRILHPNERKAFILRILCDMSGEQAAAEMGVTASRVSQLFKSAQRNLQAMFDLDTGAQYAHSR